MQKISVNNFLFCIAFIILNLFTFINSSTIPIDLSSIKYFVYGIVLVLLVLSNFDKNLNIKYILLILGIISLIVYLFYKMDNVKMSLLVLFTFVLSLKGKNIHGILKIIIGLNIFLLSLVFCLSKLGMIPNEEFYMQSGTIRQSLGMIHPNTFFNYYFMIIICILYLDKKLYDPDKRNKTVLKYVLICILTAIVYFYTNCRTGLIIFIAYLVVDYFICYKKVKLLKLYSYIPIFLLIVSIALVILYKQKIPLAIEINDVLSNRLLFANNFYKQYGISWFGNTITYKSITDGVIYNKNAILDMSYVYILIDYGIIISTIIIGATYTLLKKIISYDLRKEFLLITIILIYALTERFVFDPVPNFALVLYALLFIKNKGDLDENWN